MDMVNDQHEQLFFQKYALKIIKNVDLGVKISFSCKIYKLFFFNLKKIF
jgi:hypothetical protein